MYLRTPNHAAIAAKNDEFRKLVCDLVPTPIGKLRFTPGFQALPFETQAHIRSMIRLLEPEQFDDENNPYGERDFGQVNSVDRESTIEILDVRVFWKIDYYENSDCLWGAPDENKVDAYRVMTLMLTHEY